jgi:ribosomal protein S18 acetylase RimI-like enzyme
VNIRKYTETDYKYLQNFLVRLNEYLTELDPDKKIYTSKYYQELYINELLKLVEDNDGIIFIAEINNKSIGFIAGIIEKFTEIDDCHYKHNKEGRVLELFVDENYRKENIGKKLMENIEKYLKDKGCDFMLIDVFEHNSTAKEFYKKNGYKIRNIEMCKSI